MPKSVSSRRRFLLSIGSRRHWILQTNPTARRPCSLCSQQLRLGSVLWQLPVLRIQSAPPKPNRPARTPAATLPSKLKPSSSTREPHHHGHIHTHQAHLQALRPHHPDPN